LEDFTVTHNTSLALVAMEAAQQQEYGVIYIETEGKTAPQDLQNAGIDPAGVILIRSAITEEAWQGGLMALEKFFEDYPNEKLLFVFDSYGNTVSMRDSELDLTKDSQKPGGAAKTNRMAINKLIALMEKYPIAVLIVNYTYDNIGSVGKINAGGKALNFFSTITIQSQRVAWLDKQRQGKKVRAGVKVKWRTFKNHYAKAILDSEGNQIMLPPFVDLSITGEGFKKLE
jgi:RecA/RadA recombinase